MNRPIILLTAVLFAPGSVQADDATMAWVGKILSSKPEELAKNFSFERFLGGENGSCEEGFKSGPVYVDGDGRLMNRNEVWAVCNTLQLLGKLADAARPDPNWKPDATVDAYIRKFDGNSTGTFDGRVLYDHCIDVYGPDNESKCEQLMVETERNVHDYEYHRIPGFPIDPELMAKSVNPIPYGTRHQHDNFNAHLITDPKEAQKYWLEMKRQMGMYYP